MSLGFLGALGGLGQGMSQVGSSWADELKQQRIQAMKEKTLLAAEGREETRYQSRKAEERTYQNERDTTQYDRDLERDKAKHGQAKDLLKERARLGINENGERAGDAQKRELDLRKQWNEEKKAHMEANKYPAEGEKVEEFPDFREWKAQVGFETAAPTGSTTKPGTAAASKPGEGSTTYDKPGASGKKLSDQAVIIQKALDRGMTVDELYAHAIKKGGSEADVDDLLAELGRDPNDYKAR